MPLPPDPLRRPAASPRCLGSLATALLLATTPAGAADSLNGSLAASSRQVYRGLMLRGDAPGVQIDLHHRFDAEDAFAGLWFATGPVRSGAYGRQELNAYVGMGWRVLERWSLSLRLMHYAYPDSRLGRRYDYDELAGSATLDDWLVLTLSTSPNTARFTRQGLSDRRRSHAAELAVRQTLWGPLSLTAAAGYYDTRAFFGTAYRAAHLGLGARHGSAELTLLHLVTDRTARSLFGPTAAHGLWALSAAWSF